MEGHLFVQPSLLVVACSSLVLDQKYKITIHLSMDRHIDSVINAVDTLRSSTIKLFFPPRFIPKSCTLLITANVYVYIVICACMVVTWLDTLHLQVLFSFMVGLHNLYWYYGTQRIKMTMNGHTVFVYAAEAFQGYVVTIAIVIYQYCTNPCIYSLFNQITFNYYV